MSLHKLQDLAEAEENNARRNYEAATNERMTALVELAISNAREVCDNETDALSRARLDLRNALAVLQRNQVMEVAA